MEDSDLFLPLMSNTFGQLFRVTTFGESHGGGIGVVIDGCPPRIEISEPEIQRELDRRRPGQSKLTTQRKEEDRCELLSGVFEGRTLGTPIAILVRNKDARPEDYSEIARKFRPSHADYTYEAKYGIRNWQGGGRASARETIGRVAAGAIAKKTLSALYAHFELVAYVTQIHEVTAKIDRSTVTMNDVEKNVVRCPDGAAAKKMISLVEQIREAGDSVGGVIECVARHPTRTWRARVRQARSRAGESDAEHSGRKSVRDRFRIRGDAGARLAAQRCIRNPRRKNSHSHEQFRGRAR